MCLCVLLLDVLVGMYPMPSQHVSLKFFIVDFLWDFYANELRPLHALSPGRRAGYRDIGGIDVLDLDSRNERNLKVQNQ